MNDVLESFHVALHQETGQATTFLCLSFPGQSLCFLGEFSRFLVEAFLELFQAILNGQGRSLVPVKHFAQPRLSGGTIAQSGG
jgi:hypothetical protein